MKRLRFAFFYGACVAVSVNACAAEFPQRPVRIVVPIGPGSSMDIIARVLAQKLNEAWGQPVIVDNRAGAGGNIGAETVARAAPDGYTLLFASSSFAISPSVYRKMPYEVLRDFEPVTQISSRGNVLVVAAASTLNSVRDLVVPAAPTIWQANSSTCWPASRSYMCLTKADPRLRTI